MDIEAIEEAKSGRSTCVACRRGIKKGETRGVRSEKSFGHQEISYLCLSCTLTLCDINIQRFQGMRDYLLQVKKTEGVKKYAF